MRAAFLILIACFTSLARAESAGGAFENMQLPSRPKLSWEVLKGYRLFFHPEHKEPLRRSLNLMIPSERKVRTAWALVKLLSDKDDSPWLRVEGIPNPEYIAFEWGGLYRSSEFPDKTYVFEVHVRWTDGGALDERLLVIKSPDHPILIKVGSQDLGKHSLALKAGEYIPEEVSASFSLSQTPMLPLVARVYAPTLEDLFLAEGIQVSYRYIEDLEGNYSLGKQPWRCACQQALPKDSPARAKAKKVRCDWDTAGLEPGTYELRLSLYHKMNHPGQFDACDTPILDEDRVRITANP